MSNTHISVTDELAGYIRSVSLREPDVLRDLREETAPLPLGRMQITPEQGQFMGLLVQMLRARRTIEIGVFTGYSALSVALALPDSGQVIACDVSEEWTAIARRYWAKAGVSSKIELRLAPALDTLNALLGAGEASAFDLAFIDADKENYGAYFELALQLVRRGGIIAIDNVLWHGDVIDPAKKDADTEAIRALNLKLHADRRIALSLLPIGDGLTLALKL